MSILEAYKSRITFSVLICNFNYGNFVGEAIASAINQNYPADQFEVIVVDDGSTDHSIKEINKFNSHPNLRKIHQKNMGQLSAFKSGFNASKFEWVCLLDSDDLFMNNKLKNAAKFISTLSLEESFICHNIIMSDDRYKINENWFDSRKITATHATIDNCGLLNLFSVPCGLIFRATMFKVLMEQIPSNDWKRGADNPLVWGAFILSGGVTYLHEILARYRIHGDNHFMGSNNNGFAPKINYLDRWPKLLDWIEQLNFTGDNSIDLEMSRNKLLSHLRG